VFDPNNYCRFRSNRERSNQRLVKNVDGVAPLLSENGVPYNPEQTYELELTDLRNTIIEVRVDSVLVLTAIDNDLTLRAITLSVGATPETISTTSS